MDLVPQHSGDAGDPGLYRFGGDVAPAKLAAIPAVRGFTDSGDGRVRKSIHQTFASDFTVDPASHWSGDRDK